MKITQLYSETQGNLPNVGQVEVGQLWINAADSLIGTKKVDGTLVQYSQFSIQEKEKALNSIPKAGLISDLSLSQSAQQTSNNAVTIDDNSDLVIEATLEQGTPFTVTASLTTGHKNTKMVFTKPSGVTSSIVWQGIDLWVGGEAPQFGDTQEAHSMAIAVFSSPNNTVANIIYNTEHPVGVSGGGSASWGDIEGTLANQQDLQDALNAKADASTLSNYAPLANPALTGTATLNGQNLATVNQIPDVSQFVTESTLANYATNETVEAEFSSYDKNIKVHIESELANYLPLTGGTVSGALNVSTPTQPTEAANKQYVDSAVASVYKYKGSVANQAALPSSNQVVGDVYNCEDTGDNYAWDGTQWDKLAGTVDLSGYLTTETASETYQPKGEYIESSELENYAPLANATFTTRPTVNGTNVALATDLNIYLKNTDSLTSPSYTYNQNNNSFSIGPGEGFSANKKFTFWYGAAWQTQNASLFNLGEHAMDLVSGGEYLCYIKNGFTIDGIKGRMVWMQEGQVNKTVAFTSDIPSTETFATKTELSGYLPTSGGTINGDLSVTGALSGNTLNATSDKRLKNILNPVQDIDLSEVHAYSYQFKDDVKKQIHIGLIAQDVQKVIPEAVHSIDENGHLGIEYNALVAILVDKVTRLEKRMAELEKKH